MTRNNYVRVALISVVVVVGSIGIVRAVTDATADAGYAEDLWPSFSAHYREVSIDQGGLAGEPRVAVYDLVFDSRAKWELTNIDDSLALEKGFRRTVDASIMSTARPGFPARSAALPDGQYASPGYWLVLWETTFSGAPELLADGTTKYTEIQTAPCKNRTGICEFTRTVILDTDSQIPLFVEERLDGELLYLFEMLDIDILVN